MKEGRGHRIRCRIAHTTDRQVVGEPSSRREMKERQFDNRSNGMREREPLSTVQYLEAHIIRLCAAATTAATTYGWVLDPAGEVTLIQIALSFPELTRYLSIKNKKRVRRM